MILIASIVAFLVCAGMLWWAFMPEDEWRIESDDLYDITPLWRTRR